MRQYVFDGNVYNCELLTENMESKKLYYFLRNVQSPSDVIKVAVENMPEEYVPKMVKFEAGDIVITRNAYIDHIQEDMEIDVNLKPTEHIFDSDGNKMKAGREYVSAEGKFFKVGQWDILWQYGQTPGKMKGATLITTGSISFISGKVIEKPIHLQYKNMDVVVDESECVQSTLSGEYVPEAWDNLYIEDGDEIITRNDVNNGLTDEYEICAECDDIYPTSDMTDTHDGRICEHCLDNYYIWSEVMKEYIHNDECVWVGDDCMTDEYRENNYTQCDACGEWFNQDEEGCESDDGYDLCDSCADDYRLESGAIYYKDSGYIQEYHPDIDLHFYGNGPKFLGCEYEVQGGGCNSNIAESIFGDYREFYCSRDGSLNEGFEAITHPCSPSHMLSNIDWETIVDKLDKNGYNDTDGAGFHIHISREHFKSQSHIGKLIRFFSDNYQELVNFGNRTWDTANKWAEPTDYDTDDKFIAIYSNAKGERYSAVNVWPSTTVEIRLFGCTYRPEVIRSYIQFVDIITDLANGFYNDMTFENVRKEATERGYNELISYMDEQGI
jgi:hypothetical protein